MTRTLLIILYLIFPAHAHAATISVISGEHADFSRLVFQYPDEERWNISRFENGYILETSGEEYDYDVSSVFNLIPKTRIVKFEAAPRGALKIFTQIGFHLDAFDLRAGRLVVDIKNGLATENSKFERLKSTTKTQNTEVNVTPQIAVVLAEDITAKTTATSSGEAEGSLMSTFPNLMDTSKPRAYDNDFFLPYIDPKNSQNSRVLEMEEALFSQIGRAVSQGLLQADLPDKESAVEAAKELRSAPASTAVSVTVPILPTQPPQSDKQHVRVQTAADRDLKPSAVAPSDFDMVDFCPPENSFAIETWGEPVEDGLLLSELRGMVLGEFDQSLTQGVEKLAKYYLYLSFGAEAKVVLSEFGVFAQNSQFLRLIADVMDDGYSNSAGLLSNLLQCSGATGFWAVAAQKNLNETKDIPSHQIASYFSGLPLHLRQHLGPNLSEKFLSIGDAGTAKLIQNALSRAEGIHGDAFDLLSAEMHLNEGEIELAVDAFDTISDADGPSAAEALIRAINIRAAQNQNIDRKNAEIVEVLTIEHRGTALEVRLSKAAILARTFSGDPDLALASLAHPNLKKLLNTDDRKSLINTAALKFTTTFADIAFAKEAMTLINTGADLLLTDETKIQISERMLAIGFVDLATHFATFSDELTDQKRLLLGQIAKQSENHKDALAYVLGINNQEAALMRAELYLEIDMPQKAAKEFALANRTVAADNANFLAENWRMLSTSSDKDLALAANHFTREEQASQIEQNVTISAAQDLLDFSRSSRALFDSLIEP